MLFRYLLIFLLFTSGCASLNSVSLTPVPAQRNNKIRAGADRWIFFGFNFDNDYVNDVTRDLNAQCPNGKITGILTKDEAYFYFLFFVIKKHVEATGYCERRSVAVQ